MYILHSAVRLAEFRNSNLNENLTGQCPTICFCLPIEANSAGVRPPATNHRHHSMFSLSEIWLSGDSSSSSSRFRLSDVPFTASSRWMWADASFLPFSLSRATDSGLRPADGDEPSALPAAAAATLRRAATTCASLLLRTTFTAAAAVVVGHLYSFHVLAG
uniref:Uncharacterized protein n=1 Tax=Anopheles coluzzii TaxID=1518534 RepID=A0A8W7NZP4_ANOCL